MSGRRRGAGPEIGFECSWVQFDPVADRLLCRRCNASQPIATRVLEGLVSAASAFLRTHATCMPAPTRDERFAGLEEPPGDPAEASRTGAR